MRGVLAQLLTFDDKGQRVGSKIVFRPECNWWLKDLHDNLAEIDMTLESVLREHGEGVAQKVLEGDIVDVEVAPPVDAEEKGCPVEKGKPWHKVSYEMSYPFHGRQEDLTRF